MLAVFAKLRVQAAKAEEAEAVLRRFVEYVRDDEPGTQVYILHRGADDPAAFFVYERYPDRAALDAHITSAHFGKMFAAMGPLLDGQPVIEMCEEIAGKGM